MRVFYLSFFFCLFFQSLPSFSQSNDSTGHFKFSGYIDLYYASYNDSVGHNNYQQFPTVSPKSKQFGLNIVQITAQYTSPKVRAIATIHYGDMPLSSWSPTLNMIQEVNAGVRIAKNLWIDAGLFKTHIGTEAFLPKDNIMSSLAVMTYYEPYFQAGVKLSYSPNEKILLCLHVLNGYNEFVDNNKRKAIGLAFTYTFNDKGSIGYYNLLGNEAAIGVRRSKVRLLNNIVFNYQLTPKLKAVMGVDYVLQQNSSIKDSSKMAAVFGAIVTLRYQIKPKIGIYLRGDLFNDSQGFLTGVITDSKNNLTGYKSLSATAGIEYKPIPNTYIRLEGRGIAMDKNQKIFHKESSSINISNRLEAMLNVGVWF